MGSTVTGTLSVILKVTYALDHLSSRDIVGNNEVDKSNGTDMIMGNMSNADATM